MEPVVTYRSDRKPPDLDWDQVEVHPVNGELRELADDIKKHGLQEPIVLFQDNSEEPKCITH
jgi:ParB-like chromosome segregation protein Spo0J